ncbi:hypothetical protein IPN41_04610 [Candidatus Falkowbacteria bacterium]|nr:MAG: hypothetical protein IPN41_04610 [Candidatus Falkowbacteria bacterium]
MIGLEKPNYRIYALIIGEVLTPGKIFGCEIMKISFEDQRLKKFSPIQSIFSDDEYVTYASTLLYVDPIRLKSEYVMIYDIKERDINSAVGGAIRYFDKICRYLTVSYAQDFKNYTKRNSILSPYLYQVNKISALDDEGVESDLKFIVKSGIIYLPNRPELNIWRHADTQHFLENIFNFHDDILERTIKYLYRSSIGHFVKDSPEKIVLDHFKSIEVVINSLVKRGSFKKRVDKVAKLIRLTDPEKEKIKKLWDERSKYSDTAHPSALDQTERYPNQFPLPSNVNFSYPINDSISVDVCIKYFLYKKSLFYIEIDYISPGDEETFGEVNAQWESNRLFFSTTEKNKDKLKQKILENFSRLFKINEKSIEKITIYSRKKAVLQVVY